MNYSTFHTTPPPRAPPPTPTRPGPYPYNFRRAPTAIYSTTDEGAPCVTLTLHAYETLVREMADTEQLYIELKGAIRELQMDNEVLSREVEILRENAAQAEVEKIWYTKVVRGANSWVAAQNPRDVVIERAGSAGSAGTEESGESCGGSGSDGSDGSVGEGSDEGTVLGPEAAGKAL